MASTDDLSFSVSEIADICQGRWSGDSQQAAKIVRRVSPIEEAADDAVTWLADKRRRSALEHCGAAAVIGRQALIGDFDRGILVDDPELAIARVLEQFYIPPHSPASGIHPSAIVHPTAKLGTGVAVGALAVIQEDAKIGDHAIIHEGVIVGKDVQIASRSVLFDRVVIYDRCRIGRDVILHAGVVIGADGFGYIFRDGRHRKLKHLGGVVIEDRVEIGANSCVDRGKLGDTRIGEGTKIDDLVMIAHNVQIGGLCIITAQCAIAGSARLGSGVIMGGRSGISHGISVGDNARIAATAVLFSDVSAGSTVSGTPAQDNRTELRDISRVRKLPKLLKRVAELEKRVAELEGTTDHRKSG